MLYEFELLQKYNINIPKYKVCKNIDQAISFANEIKYPVVLKLYSKKYTHKSDVGGVYLNIRTDEGLKKTYSDLMKKIPKKDIQGVLVQEQAKTGLELFMGAKADEQFGHIILFGIGGIFVELLKDISARICPIELPDAYEMIDELKYKQLLFGFRGTQPISKKQIAELLVKVSKLVVKENIKELDLNPVIAYRNKYIVVDSRIIKG